MRAAPAQRAAAAGGRARRRYLGGYIAAAFFGMGAPSALVIGYLSDRVNRRNLLFAIVLLGSPRRPLPPARRQGCWRPAPRLPEMLSGFPSAATGCKIAAHLPQLTRQLDGRPRRVAAS